MLYPDLFYFILALILANIVVLAYKIYREKDVSILGSIIARVYLFFVIGYILKNGIDHQAFIISLFLIFFSDVFSAIVSIANKIDCKKTTKDLARKLSDTLDTSLTPFFTVNMDGTIEYANTAFLYLCQDQNAIGKPFYEVLNVDCSFTSELAEFGKIYCNLKTKSGENKVLFIGNRTKNGHETITGSIYILD